MAVQGGLKVSWGIVSGMEAVMVLTLIFLKRRALLGSWESISTSQGFSGGSALSSLFLGSFSRLFSSVLFTLLVSGLPSRLP